MHLSQVQSHRDFEVEIFKKREKLFSLSSKVSRMRVTPTLWVPTLGRRTNSLVGLHRSDLGRGPQVSESHRLFWLPATGVSVAICSVLAPVSSERVTQTGSICKANMLGSHRSCSDLRCECHNVVFLGPAKNKCIRHVHNSVVRLVQRPVGPRSGRRLH